MSAPATNTFITRAFTLPVPGDTLQSVADRVLPGVDVLETRWSAANRIFKENGVNVVGAEFTGGDNAKTKQIVEDYINKNGKIDAVSGATYTSAGYIQSLQSALDKRS